MDILSHALATMAARSPRQEALSPADAERLGQISTPTGRALVVGWPDALFAKGLVPARLWLHKGPDQHTNTLGWATVGMTDEVWLVSKGGQVDVLRLIPLRKALLAHMRGPSNTYQHDIIAGSAHQRSVYRPVPLSVLAGAHIGTFSPGETP